MRLEFTVSTGGLPLLMNAERSRHWSARSKAMNEWKQATHTALLTHGFHRHQFEQAAFWFFPLYNKGRLPDTAATYPVEKAIVDACVASGLIPDDNSWHVAATTSQAPRIDRDLQCPEIVVVAQSYPAHDDHTPRDGCGCRDGYELQMLASG